MTAYKEKKQYLCSPIIGERLRIPVSWSVNSGVFGRAQWFVNRRFSIRKTYSRA
jgi:hypothetical protein